MCVRIACLAPINGDFAIPGTDEPLGGFADDGVLERSPNPSHPQRVVQPEGTLWAGQRGWSGKLVATNLATINLAGL